MAVRRRILTLGTLALLGAAAVCWWDRDPKAAWDGRDLLRGALAPRALGGGAGAASAGPIDGGIAGAAGRPVVVASDALPPPPTPGTVTAWIASDNESYLEIHRGHLLLLVAAESGASLLLEEGRAQDVPAGDWCLLAGPGHGDRAPWLGRLVVRPGEHLDVRIDAPRGRSLALTLVDAWGEPVQQHEVALSYAWPLPLPSGPTWAPVETEAVAVSRGGHRTGIACDGRSVTLRRRTSDDGSTWFEGLPDGAVTVRIDGGPGGVVEQVLDCREREVRLTVPVPAVSLRVRFPPPPADHGWLAAARPGAGGDLTWQFARTGTMLLRGLQPGDHDVWIVGRLGLRRRLTLTGAAPPEVGFTVRPVSNPAPG